MFEAGTESINPLRLPQPIKRIGRVLRDHPRLNRVGTALVRSLAPESSIGRWERRFPKIGTVETELPTGETMTFCSDRAEAVHTSIFYRGWRGSEPEVLPLWSEEAAKASTIIDVGAHIGHFSIVAGLINRAAALHCFEPHPEIRAYLERNLALNKLGGRAHVHAIALSDEAGEADFFVGDVDLPSSSSLSKKFMANSGAYAGKTVSVEMEPLDRLIVDPGSPVLMKIDTESTEADVLLGAASLIRRARPTIFLEVLSAYDTSEELNAAIRKIGVPYDAYLLTGEGPIHKSTIEPDPRWRNYFLRARP